MIDVLEMQPETESNRSLLQNLESKVMNIQSQLRSVKEKLEKGIVVPKNSSGFSPPLRGLVTASHGGRFSGRVSLFGRGYRGRTPGRGGRTFGRGSEENRPVGQSTEQTELQSTILNPGIAQEMISDVAIVEETTNQTGQVN